MSVLLEAPELAPANGIYTPDDLLAMPEGGRFELIDGKLVERNMGAKSSRIAARWVRIMDAFVETHKLGMVFTTDCGYQIFSDNPQRVRFPDGSFIAKGRLPEEKTPGGHVRIPPDLAVEVVSPNDTAEEVEAKRLAFLRAGVRQVWIVFPESRTLHTHAADGSCRVSTEGDTLSGGDVLPNFTCAVAAFFEGID